MLERFTGDARGVVTGARESALRLGHDWIGCEHLLLALAATGGEAGVVLRDQGITLPWRLSSHAMPPRDHCPPPEESSWGRAAGLPVEQTRGAGGVSLLTGNANGVLGGEALCVNIASTRYPYASRLARYRENVNALRI